MSLQFWSLFNTKEFHYISIHSVTNKLKKGINLRIRYLKSSKFVFKKLKSKN